MVMSAEALQNSIIIIASILAAVCFILFTWVIALQLEISKLKRNLKELGKQTENHSDDLAKRGYQQYQGSQPQFYNGRPEMQRQTSAQTSMYRNSEPLSRAPSSMTRGYQQQQPSNRYGYDNAGYDDRRLQGNYGPPPPGNYGSPPPGNYGPPGVGGARSNGPNPMGKYARDFAKDVATDFATDFAKDQAMGALEDMGAEGLGEQLGEVDLGALKGATKFMPKFGKKKNKK